MALTLYVDGDRWRRHLRSVSARQPDLVPVAKGNGYGLGIGRLARRAAWLGVDTMAVGTYEEVPEVRQRFPGDVVVLTPWRTFQSIEQTGGPDLLADPRLVHTVSRVEDLVAIAAAEDSASRRPRVVLERMTSMRRHGLSAPELRQAAETIRQSAVRCAGFALHLPLGSGSHLAEVERLMTDIVSTGLDARTVWVSHLADAELTRLRASYPDFTFRPRIGTDLWLGDRGALEVRAHVLDVHHVERGDAYGYRGRTAVRPGSILVVSGGTAHGIGLESPTSELSLRSGAATLARGGLDAFGLVRSPFTVAGKPRLFAEPPHMQASMLFLPEGAETPAVGEEVGVRCRHTATWFDRILVS